MVDVMAQDLDATISSSSSSSSSFEDQVNGRPEKKQGSNSRLFEIEITDTRFLLSIDKMASKKGVLNVNLVFMPNCIILQSDCETSGMMDNAVFHSNMFPLYQFFSNEPVRFCLPTEQLKKLNKKLPIDNKSRLRLSDFQTSDMKGLEFKVRENQHSEGSHRIYQPLSDGKDEELSEIYDPASAGRFTFNLPMSSEVLKKRLEFVSESKTVQYVTLKIEGKTITYIGATWTDMVVEQFIDPLETEVSEPWTLALDSQAVKHVNSLQQLNSEVILSAAHSEQGPIVRFMYMLNTELPKSSYSVLVMPRSEKGAF